MKKIITLIAATALLAASCQKETPVAENTGNASGKLTATIVNTRVSYTETSSMNLQPAWEVGDEIIGFDDAGNTHTLTVASVEAQTATLSGTVPDGALHLIYKSGAQASDISSKSLAIDYTDQKGDKTMPAVMLADGTVEDGACEFAFTNAGAIIGISAVNGVPSGSSLSKITVEGSNLSAATVALSGSALALTAATVATDAISTAALSGITVTDANGTLSKPVFIAVPFGAVITKVSVSVPKEPETMKIPSTAADKKNIDYVEIAAKYDGTNVTTKKWAKWNVGANTEKDYGWYFQWGGTEGYVPTEISGTSCKWVSVSGVDSYSYTLSSAKTAVASDYLYVNTQPFIGFLFNWAHAPFNNGKSTFNASYFDSVRSTVCPGYVLAIKYDAARANWGDTWRMPTMKEFQAMKDATYWAWDSTDKGYYVYAPNPATDAGKINSNGTGSYSKDTALLFFPAAGCGYDAILSNTGSNSFYWSSIRNSDGHAQANTLLLNSSIVKKNNNICSDGNPVRPVSN